MVYAGVEGEIVTGPRRIGMSNGSGRRRFHPFLFDQCRLEFAAFSVKSMHHDQGKAG
jgi:hypothetical protein